VPDGFLELKVFGLQALYFGPIGPQTGIGKVKGA
jgi:hypothetical protein